MNLRDRLKSTIKLKKMQNYQNMDNRTKRECSFMENFVKNENIDNALSQILSLNCNVIFASSIKCDNVVISSYIKSLLPSDINVESIYDFNSNMKFVNSSKIIFANPNIKEFVKILEYIQYGYKNFIFGINVCQSDNILDIIRTLIMLNFSNLSEKNVDTLLTSASPFIIYFNKNSDGLLKVDNISKIVCDGTSLKLENVTPNNICKSQEDFVPHNVEPKLSSNDNDSIYAQKIKENDVNLDEISESDGVNFQGEIENIVELQDDEIVETIEENQSVEVLSKNKYKLLKEKLKRKKQEL